jgi:acyl-CoA oxidase
MDRGVLGLNGVIGCFAMTELAHGSNVAGLETTATFDPASDDFVIHTPHLGATKWWIGGAASTATHAAVFAQMIVHGKRHGVKTFVVQLRDTK